MTVPLELSREMETQLRLRATAAGQELSVFILEMLEAMLVDEDSHIAAYSVEEWHTIDVGIARGIADADAGRTRPVEEVFARLRATLPVPEKG